MGKIVKNTFGNFLIVCLIFILMTGWMFSGWPRIWEKPAIPPEIQEVLAVTDTVEYIIDTASTTWTVPTDWTASNTIEVIGGGGGGFAGVNGCAGGGGGAYAIKSNLSGLTPGSTVYLQVGTGGATTTNGVATWFNDTDATTTVCGNQSVCANPGNGGAATTEGSGGASSTSIGDVAYRGGDGGDSTNDDPGGGGGGAGGPHGNGGYGGAGHTSATNGAGGGGGGGGGGTYGQPGTSSTPYGGAGGNNWQGSGGAATSSGAGNVGTLGGGGGGGIDAESGGVAGNGIDWSNSPAYGSGGGGGGAGDPDAIDMGGAGGLYGGGGGGGGGGGVTQGRGAQGIIVIHYTSNNAPSFTSNTEDSPDPVVSGNTVTFTATSTDSESDSWWLAVCKTDAITAGSSGAAPSCASEANAYCTSTFAVASGAKNTCDWISSGSGAQNWWSFGCDNNTITSKCSATDATSTANSPINVSVTISVSVDVANYDYGAMAMNSTASSTVIIATNNGSGNENFDIIGSDAATTSPYMWELSTSTTGTDIYMHAYTTDSTEPSGTATGTDPAVGWAPLDKDGIYNTLATGVLKDNTVQFYLDMRTPAIAGASTTYDTPYETTVTVRASAP